jgi:PadR family transcriptional regulator, regulatory protein PadR
MSSELLRGTLDLLVLRVIEKEPLHGWGIAQRINQLSGDQLKVNQGALYPAIYRLEAQGLLKASEGLAENGRKVRCYGLTAHGRKRLAEEREGWGSYARAVQLILENA